MRAMQVTDKDALIVVDVQNDFVTGTMAVPDAKLIIGPINRLAEVIPTVVVATDWHPMGHVSLASSHPGKVHGDTIEASYGPQRVYHDHCVQETWGAELDPDLKLGMAQLILRKGYRMGVESNGAFFENDGVTDTGLAGYLRGRGIERVFCTGLARFGCVMQTALGGARAGLKVYMVDDGSKGRPGPSDEASKEKLAAAGVGWVHSSDIVGAIRAVA
jgi:nicotinamidase/pyrazinamidase